jgi:hypothetical protein
MAIEEKSCVQRGLRYGDRRKVLCSTESPVRRRKKNPLFSENSGKATEKKSCVQRDLRYGNGRKVLRVQRDLQHGDFGSHLMLKIESSNFLMT